MKIAVGSDERTHLTDVVIEEIQKRGHDLLLFGPLAENDPEVDWPLTSSKVAESVATHKADEGIVFCWTGTGASIAANKVPGIRAALPEHDVFLWEGHYRTLVDNFEMPKWTEPLRPSLGPEVLLRFGHCCDPGYFVLAFRYDHYFAGDVRDIIAGSLGFVYF